MKSREHVAITRCTTYSDEDVYPALKEVLLHGNMPSVMGKTILLKPNILSDAHPQKAITTRGEVIGNLIKILYEMGAKRFMWVILLVLVEIILLLNILGSTRHVKKITVIGFNSLERQHLKIPFTYGKKLPLPTILDEVDYVFSVAKMKTHQ